MDQEDSVAIAKVVDGEYVFTRSKEEVLQTAFDARANDAFELVSLELEPQDDGDLYLVATGYEYGVAMNVTVQVRQDGKVVELLGRTTYECAGSCFAAGGGWCNFLRDSTNTPIGCDCGAGDSSQCKWKVTETQQAGG